MKSSETMKLRTQIRITVRTIIPVFLMSCCLFAVEQQHVSVHASSSLAAVERFQAIRPPPPKQITDVSEKHESTTTTSSIDKSTQNKPPLPPPRPPPEKVNDKKDENEIVGTEKVTKLPTTLTRGEDSRRQMGDAARDASGMYNVKRPPSRLFERPPPPRPTAKDDQSRQVLQGSPQQAHDVIAEERKAGEGRVAAIEKSFPRHVNQQEERIDSSRLSALSTKTPTLPIKGSLPKHRHPPQPQRPMIIQKSEFVSRQVGISMPTRQVPKQYHQQQTWQQQERPHQHNLQQHHQQYSQYPSYQRPSHFPQQHRYPQQGVQRHYQPQQHVPRQQQPKPLPQRKSRWKALWSRVEQGLDELVNLEDTVSHGAKRILASSSAMISKSGGDSGKTWEKKKQKSDKKATAVNAKAKNWNDLMAGKKNVIRAGASSNPPHQHASEHLNQNATAKPPPFTGQAAPRPSETNGRSPRHVDWPARPKDTEAPIGTDKPSPLDTTKASSQALPKQLTPPNNRHQLDGRRSSSAVDGWSTSQISAAVDDDSPNIFSRIVRAVPSPVRLLKRRSSSSLAVDAWRDRDEVDRLASADARSVKQKWTSRLLPFGEKTKEAASVSARRTLPRKSLSGKYANKSSSPTAQPLQEALDRYSHGRDGSLSLLSSRDARNCHAIGRQRAFSDIVCLGLILLGVREMSPVVQSLQGSTLSLRSVLSASLDVVTDTWAPFALMAAVLVLVNNSVKWNPRIQRIASESGDAVRELTLYSQLYLRLMSSLPLQRNVAEWSQWTTGAQAIAMVASTRLSSFALMALVGLCIATMSFVRPVLVAITSALVEVMSLPQLRTWPVPWAEFNSEVQNVFKVLGETMSTFLGMENAGSFLKEHPKMLLFQVSVVVSLLTVSRLPSLVQRRKVFEDTIEPSLKGDHLEDEAAASWLASSTENLNKLGASSASRLNLQAENGMIEGTLDRWRMMKRRRDPAVVASTSLKSLLGRVGLSLSAAVVLATPLVLHILLGLQNSSQLGFDSVVVNLSVILVFSSGLVWDALGRLSFAGAALPPVKALYRTLADTVDETLRLQSPQGDMQIAAMVSPSKGLVASEIWAAHTAKRAWAVRGASFSCLNGQVLVVLGGDGGGKTRLLTTLVEATVLPPKRSQSTTRVRGTLSVGGIDVTKWDRTQLKKRLGIFLSDVRTVTYLAELMSGLTLEEILEPFESARSINEPHSPGGRERSAIALAMKITGISTTLLPRLPSKLSTVVSANEDELKPTALRPPSSALSPSEWTKVLLTKVLAQAIYDNDNQAKSHNSVDKCLLGSVLILDDVTASMSEAEEARFLLTLRRTGAATILSSHKWATGRLADQIVVMKDGAVAESGSHSDLIAVGPQHGSYAAEWHSMGPT